MEILFLSDQNDPKCHGHSKHFFQKILVVNLISDNYWSKLKGVFFKNICEWGH